MALPNHGLRSPLGVWDEAALEWLKRDGTLFPDFLGCRGNETGQTPSTEATRVHAMASAVWELHEERSLAPPHPLEPRLRSLKGQNPDPEPRLIQLGLERLRSLPPSRWSRWVRLHHYDYRGAAVARAFLAEAREALPADPPLSATWARLVHQAAGLDRLHYCSHDPEQIGLQIRAHLYEANAARCNGELERADLGFRHAQAEALRLAVTDPVFWSELASFRASLHRDRRQFRRALRDAELAAAIRVCAGDRNGEARALWKVASIHEQLGEASQALTVIRRVTPFAASLPDRKLAFGVLHAEVFYLARCGDFLEAYVAYRVLDPDYPQYPDYEPFRLWVVGLISHGLGRHLEAEEAYREARSFLLRDRNPYDAALVTLDWSLFLLDQNRPEAVLPLAVSMGQAFEALGVARETLASWAIFQAAAERRELTRTVAESMVRTLGEERAGAKPER